MPANKLIIGIACAVAAAGLGSLAGCATTGADNTLAKLSQNEIPAACAIVEVAEGYFNNVKPKVSASAKQVAADAEITVAAICANPPANTAAALGDLMTAWTNIQSATTVPVGVSPTPVVVPVGVSPTPVVVPAKS